MFLTLLNLGADITIFTLQQTYRFSSWVWNYNKIPPKTPEQLEIEKLKEELELIKKSLV